MTDTRPASASQAAETLPYDPVEWEQRLAAARVARAAALKRKGLNEDDPRLGLGRPPEFLEPLLPGAEPDDQAAAAPAYAPRAVKTGAARGWAGTRHERRLWLAAVAAALFVGGIIGATTGWLTGPEPVAVAPLPAAAGRDPAGSQAAAAVPGPVGPGVAVAVDGAPEAAAAGTPSETATASEAATAEAGPFTDSGAAKVATDQIAPAGTAELAPVPAPETHQSVPAVRPVARRLTPADAAAGPTTGLPPVVADRAAAFPAPQDLPEPPLPDTPATATGLAAGATVDAVGAGHHVVVYAPPSVTARQRDEVVAALAAADWQAGAPRQTRFTIAETQVRFYHAEDRPAAEALAARLQVAARDFTGYSPLPEPGMLELWLEGKGPPSGSGKAASARQAARPAGPPDLVRFLKRLAAGPGHH